MNTTTAPSWELPPATPVPMRQWGKDHWTTLAYIETRITDYRGMLDHDHLRCDNQRHPAFRAAKRRATAIGSSVDGGQYPTRLKTGAPDDAGVWGTVELPGHDDYDCIADLIREGLLEVLMPQPNHDWSIFTDAWDRAVRLPDGHPLNRYQAGELISPTYVTGLSEAWLMTAASYSLTDKGRAIAAELSAHRTGTRRSHQFTPSCLAENGNGNG